MGVTRYLDEKKKAKLAVATPLPIPDKTPPVIIIYFLSFIEKKGLKQF
jgi:hypothetical protein